MGFTQSGILTKIPKKGDFYQKGDFYGRYGQGILLPVTPYQSFSRGQGNNLVENSNEMRKKKKVKLD